MKKLFLVLALLVACATPKPTVVAPAEKPDPNERTLWAVCLNDPGELVEIPSDTPPHTPACEHPQPIKYKSRPVLLYASGSPLADVLAAYSALWWNEQLGFELVRYSPAEPPAESDAEGILLFTKFDENGWILGQAFPVWTGKAMICGAGVFHEGEAVAQTAVHEVGHCLGLAHDADNVGSVMYPYMTGKPYEVTVADRQALKRLYGIR